MKNFIYLSIAVFAFVACSKNVTDETKPTISIEHPAAAAMVNAGGTMHLHVVLADDIALASYTINIAEATDHEGHDHSRSEWAWDTSGTISGLSYTMHAPSLSIPMMADTGEYAIHVNCIDSLGNEADEMELLFHVMPMDTSSSDDMDHDDH